MELKELFHIKTARASFLPFSTSWSDDDRISVVAESGVHVMRFCPDVTSVNSTTNLQRSWLKLECMTLNSDIDVESLLWQLDKEKTYELMMDISLSPDLTLSKPVKATVTRVAWSPGNMFQNIKCLLAVVTNYGTVQLYRQDVLEWFLAEDVSSKWTTYCKRDWQNVTNMSADEKFEALKLRINMLKALCVGWSGLYCSKSTGYYCYLVVGHKSGDVSIWEVSMDTSYENKVLHVNLALHLKSPLKKLSCVYWCNSKSGEALLFVGNSSGIIQGYKLVMKECRLLLTAQIPVWPSEDDIGVAWIGSFPTRQNDKYITVVAVKCTFIVLISVNLDGGVVSTSCRRIGNIAITGVSMLDYVSAIITTQTGVVHKIVIERNSAGDIKQTLQTVSMPKNMVHWKPCGLAVSLNKAICVIVYRIAQMYDHLVHRETLRTTFYTYKDVPTMLSTLVMNPSQKLTMLWDHVEALRSLGISTESLPDFDEYIFKADLDSCSLYQLKLMLALTRVALAQNDPSENNERTQLLQVNLKVIKTLLFIKHACQTVRKLVGLVKDGAQLSEHDLCSLGLFRAWLRSVNFRKDTTNGSTQSMVEETVSLPLVPGELKTEYCNICGSESAVDSNLLSKCRKGHTIPRCYLSLRQCTELPSARCTLCGATAHRQCVSSGSPPLCLYCDCVLEVDRRVVLESDDAEEFVEEQLDDSAPSIEQPV